MTNIVSNKASTHTQNLFVLALDNCIIKRKKKPALFGGGTFGKLKWYNSAFRPAGESPDYILLLLFFY